MFYRCSKDPTSVVQSLAFKEAGGLAFLPLNAGLYSPGGARASTRHHCSNRSNASSRDTQEYAVAAYSQKKWSQELFLQRIGRPRITEIRRGSIAEVCG
jgi:hypothetical protein